MTPGTIIMVIRLACGLCLSAYGLAMGAWHWMIQGRPGEALAHVVIWGLAGCLIAPLAEDVEDMARRLIERTEKRK